MRARGALLVIVALAAPVRAWTEATPTFTLPQEIAIGAVKGTAEAGLAAMTGGVGTVVVKANDVLLAVGEAGVARRDQTLGAEWMASERWGQLLKSMHDAHIDTRDDWRAKQARAQLVALRTSMLSGEDGLGYAAYAVGRNPKYAILRGSIAVGLSAAVGKLASLIHLDDLGENLAFGAWTKNLLGSKGPLAGALRWTGWRRLDSRATVAKSIVDTFASKMAEQPLDKAADEALKDAEERIRGDTWADIERRNPSHRIQIDRLADARASLAPAPALALPVAAAPAPVAAPAALSAAYADPREVRAVVNQDPMVAVSRSDDRWMERYDRARREPEPTRSPPPEPVMQEAPQPTIRERQWRHEWDCAGAGAKPGCDWPPSGGNSWDGRRGQSLRD